MGPGWGAQGGSGERPAWAGRPSPAPLHWASPWRPDGPRPDRPGCHFPMSLCVLEEAGSGDQKQGPGAHSSHTHVGSFVRAEISPAQPLPSRPKLHFSQAGEGSFQVFSYRRLGLDHGVHACLNFPGQPSCRTWSSSSFSPRSPPASSLAATLGLQRFIKI